MLQRRNRLETYSSVSKITRNFSSERTLAEIKAVFLIFFVFLVNEKKKTISKSTEKYILRKEKPVKDSHRFVDSNQDPLLDIFIGNLENPTCYLVGSIVYLQQNIIL